MQRNALLCSAVYPELFALVGGHTPDLRGLFLRGHGGNSAALGEQQGDVDGHFGIGSGSYSKHTTRFDLSRVVPTADENRPVNMAVRYLVRARP